MTRTGIFLICFVTLMYGCLPNEEGLCIIGSGTADTFTVEVESFNEIALFGPISLRIRQDQQQQVRVQVEPNIFPIMTYEVEAQRLEIGLKEDIRCFETEVGVLVDITTPELEEVFVVGASEIATFGELNLDRLKISVQGAAEIGLQGTIEEQIFSISGEAQVYNWELSSSRTKINVTGNAEMQILCEDLLEVDALGSVVVKYKGNPQITETGTGSITILNYNGN